jgi:hypothetical protein
VDTRNIFSERVGSFKKCILKIRLSCNFWNERSVSCISKVFLLEQMNCLGKDESTFFSSNGGTKCRAGLYNFRFMATKFISKLATENQKGTENIPLCIFCTVRSTLRSVYRAVL